MFQTNKFNNIKILLLLLFLKKKRSTSYNHLQIKYNVSVLFASLLQILIRGIQSQRLSMKVNLIKKIHNISEENLNYTKKISWNDFLCIKCHFFMLLYLIEFKFICYAYFFLHNKFINKYIGISYSKQLFFFNAETLFNKFTTWELLYFLCAIYNQKHFLFLNQLCFYFL